MLKNTDKHLKTFRFAEKSLIVCCIKQWCSQPKILRGAKCLTLGEKQYFCLGRRVSKHKMSRHAKIWGIMAPWAFPGYAHGTN